MHALKIEDLKISKRKADLIIETIQKFMLKLGYSQESIESLESRRKDGFIPYSHNKGGLQAMAFGSQYCFYNTGCTGFKNADDTLELYQSYNLESFKKDNPELPEDQCLWSENTLEKFDEYCDDSESTLLFSLDIMLTSETKLNLRFCICVKDAPYHRQYDDLIDLDIEFSDHKDLGLKLKEVLKNEDVHLFSGNLEECF